MSKKIFHFLISISEERKGYCLLLISCCFFTTIGSYFFLTSGDLDDYKNQLLGSLTFTANFALLDQSGYFDSDAHLKPLLHMWSLAIEEQFYFLLPIILYFIPLRFWLTAVTSIIVASFLLGLSMVADYPDSVFYLLPTRAWELAIGCYGALSIEKRRLNTLYQWLFWPSVLVLIIIPIFPISPVHPSIDAALVCLATLVIIMRQSSILNKQGLISPLAKIGDYSYSLYLVHWPLFSLVANAYIAGSVPLTVRLSLLLLSFVLAALLYHIIEKPIHKAQFSSRRRLVIPLCISAVAIAATLFLVLHLNKSGTDYKNIRRANYGLDAVCDQTGVYEDLDKCRDSTEPEILIWGDSYAMHLVPGIKFTTDKPIIQITRSACGPLLGVSYMQGPKRARAWAESCIQFNDEAFMMLKNTPSVHTVVISSPFNAYVNPAHKGIKMVEGKAEDIDMGIETALEAMSKTIQEIRELGKKVVVVSPPPENGSDIGGCLERVVSGKFVLGIRKHCDFSMDDYRAYHQNVIDFLERLSDEADVTVIWLSDYLCSGGICQTILNGKLVYRDSGHLTYVGARELFKEYRVIEEIYKEAY